MKLHQWLGVALLGVVLSSSSFAWENRPNVIRAAEILLEHSEHLDDTLHEAKAPVYLVKAAHLLEDFEVEFIEQVKSGTPRQQVLPLFDRIRNQVTYIRKEINRFPAVGAFHEVEEEIRYIRTSVRLLDRELYHDDHARWDEKRLDDLQIELSQMGLTLN